MDKLKVNTRCYDLTSLDEAQQEEVFAQAGAVIRRGGTVVFPTETVYGLGADAMKAESVHSIYQAKGRPSDNPLIIHVADFDLSGIALEVPPQAERLMKKYWPGPLTIILKKDPRVPQETTGSLNTVGVRMPDQPVALALIKASGTVIAAPSANISGRPSPTTYERCRQDLEGRVDMILGMDQSRVGLESTIIDLSGEVPELLRPGAVTLEELRKDLGEVIYRPSESLQGDQTPRAPGMKYRHYAPKAPVTLFQGNPEQVRDHMLKEREENTLLIFIDREIMKGFTNKKSLRQRPLNQSLQAEKHSRNLGTWLVHFKSVEEAAQGIFETLRRADDQEAEAVWIQTIPEQGLGLSLMNRLKKAAAYKIKEVSK
ncbi:MAG: threonylcarbamoyl-AMP synthase [Clostridium sp.]|nr:threonylcarbamoyl-AMP synthase [Clostridium sp.]